MTASEYESDEPVGSIEDAPVVSQLRTTPERFVFTEDGNSEGWIATDHVVAVNR
jgi:hypothetical protein